MDKRLDEARVRMRRIKLERARDKGGQSDHGAKGYEFVAPLDADGHIDVESWRNYRTVCFVHRLENGMIRDRGLLVHRAGGEGGATWAFDYELGEGEEESGFRFGAHPFIPGEYVSIRDEDGDLHTYQVVSVSAM